MSAFGRREKWMKGRVGSKAGGPLPGVHFLGAKRLERVESGLSALGDPNKNIGPELAGVIAALFGALR
jgi:hypothetical protein